MIHLRMVFFRFILIGFHSASWIYRCISAVKFGKFPAIFKKKIFFPFHSAFPFLRGKGHWWHKYWVLCYYLICLWGSIHFFPLSILSLYYSHWKNCIALSLNSLIISSVKFYLLLNLHKKVSFFLSYCLL